MVYDHFDLSCSDAKFSHRSLFDVRSGSEILSWRPRTEGSTDGCARSAFALSPDGKLLAEGAAGSVQLYRID